MTALHDSALFRRLEIISGINVPLNFTVIQGCTVSIHQFFYSTTHLRSAAPDWRAPANPRRSTHLKDLATAHSGWK